MQERRICTGWKTRLFVKKCQYTELSLDNIDARLVIRELDEGPVNLLSHVLLLLEFEHVSVELW